MISASTRTAVEHARMLMGVSRWEEAMDAWRDVLTDAAHPDYVYDDWVRALAESASRAGHPAVAALCREYLLDPREARTEWKRAGRLDDEARCLARAGDPAGAARTFEQVGAFGRAAAAWEDAGDAPSAARCWERASQVFADRGARYLTALALLNLGIAWRSLGDVRHRPTLARAMILLMEEADDAEGAHDTDRAVACFHALIHVGRATGTHENLAEGFLNCIRLMGERDHRFFALQYFHDFAEASLALGEHQAAAEVLRDAAAFCRRTGVLYADHFLGRSALAFEAAAVAQLEAGAPAELAENALLAALDAHNRRGDVGRVHATYRRLAALPLTESRQQRYAELAVRRPQAQSAADGWPFRGYFDAETAYPPRWRIHLLEADGARDPFATLVAAVGDRKLWEVVRRRSFLVATAREASGVGPEDPDELERLVVSLGRLGSPLALEPLARIQQTGEPRVRVAVAGVLRFLPYRRTLELVGRGLSDPEPEVRREALAALRFLAFPGAFAPLIRLYKDHDAHEVRREILLALGRVVGMDQETSRDALDFMLHVWREQTDDALVETLQTAIGLNVSPFTLPTVERHRLAEPAGELRAFLDRLAPRLDARRITAKLGA